MMTKVDKLTILVFVEGLGIPASEVLSEEWAGFYEDRVRHLLAARLDADDVIGEDMGEYDRWLIRRAAEILRDLLSATNHRPEDYYGDSAA